MHQIAPMSEDQEAIKAAAEKTLEPFDDEYWGKVDETGNWPEEFCDAMAKGGWLGIAFPEEYGGAGLGLTEAALMMQTVTRTGAGFSGASAIHLNIFGPKPLEKFGNPELKQENLPKIISGEEKMCFAVTEPNSGLDTSSLETKAERTNNGYVINGRKIWTTGAQRADKILIIARTTPKDQCAKPHLGLSLFYTDLNRNRIEANPIPKMGRKAVECNTLFIDNLEVPKEHLIGEEGQGFKYLLQGLNPERVLFAVESIGLASQLWSAPPAMPMSASCSAVRSARTRASSTRWPGHGRNCRPPSCSPTRPPGYTTRARIAGPKRTLRNISHRSGLPRLRNCRTDHGGMGYAKEYHVERMMREAMLARIAPVSREMILNFIAERVLGLPKSY